MQFGRGAVEGQRLLFGAKENKLHLSRAQPVPIKDLERGQKSFFKGSLDMKQDRFKDTT